MVRNRQIRIKNCQWRKKTIDCGLPDNKEFEEAMIMTVLGTETKVVDKKRLKVF